MVRQLPRTVYHSKSPRTVNDAMNVLFRSVTGLAILAIALGLGFAAALAVILVMNAMLPAFRPEEDETLRELIPAGIVYATMAGTAGLVVLVAWRRLRSRSTVTSRDIRER